MTDHSSDNASGYLDDLWDEDEQDDEQDDEQAMVDHQISVQKQLEQNRNDPTYPARMGLTESNNYPGYYHHDPRWFGLTVEDRYLMDHPGPNYRTKENLSHLGPKRMPEAREAWASMPDVVEQAEREVGQAQHYYELLTRLQAADAAMPTGRYVCQVCERRVAQWPRERKARLNLLFWQPRITYVTPFVCSPCRILRWPEVAKLGKGRRRFWKNVLAVLLGENYPTAGPTVQRLNRYRRLWSQFWRF